MNVKSLWEQTYSSSLPEISTLLIAVPTEASCDHLEEWAVGQLSSATPDFVSKHTGSRRVCVCTTGTHCAVILVN